MYSRPGTEVAPVRATGRAEAAAVQAAALAGIRLATEVAALVALDVAAAGAAVPDQCLGLGHRALLGVPAVAVLLALQGVGVVRLCVAPSALRLRRRRPARAAV